MATVHKESSQAPQVFPLANTSGALSKNIFAITDAMTKRA